MENRRQKRSDSKLFEKNSPLPLDFTKSVTDVMSGHFEEALKALKKNGYDSKFEVSGQIFADEVVLAVCLASTGKISAVTVYGSMDFDPKASFPKINDVVGFCVDGVGSVFGTLLESTDPEALTKLMDAPLHTIENIPTDWEAIEVENRKLYIKVDKTNLKLDQLTDEWLEKNDPNYKELKAKEQEEVESLFVTGKKSKGDLH